MNVTKAISSYAKGLKAAMLALFFVACGGDENASDPNPSSDPDAGTYTVTFDSNQGTNVPFQQVEKGNTVPRPPNPTRQGHFFRAWCSDPALQNVFDFDAPITASIILYARWEAIAAKFWVPDPRFRDTLKALIPEAFDRFDSLITQHADVKELAVLEIGSSSIADLAGIEYFTALTQLYCSDNDLTKLEVSQNTALTQLKCSFNLLTGLDVSQNASLTVLECSHNQLTRLELSQNSALEHLLCQHNELTGLRLSQNASLRILECNHNQLTRLSLSQNASLTGLSCHSNRLTGLDVSQNAALTWLFCYDNALTELDMRGMRSAGFVDALQLHGSSTYPPLNTLKVHENLRDAAALKEAKTARGADVTISTYSAVDGSTDYMLECADYDPISETCLSTVSGPDFTVAFDLNGGVGNIDTLTVGQGQNATKPDPDPMRDGYTFKGWFADDDTFDNEFDFTASITSDTTLYAKWEKIPKFWIPDKNFRNKLKSLMPNAFDGRDSLLTQHPDVTKRTFLYVSESRYSLNIADLSGIEYFTALEKLYCSNNKLNSLDLSKNIRLKQLWCYHNQLTELDVSHHTALTNLRCSHNQLTSLNVQQNVALELLWFYGNKVTNLDVSKNTNLRSLDCGGNQLKKLDVSTNIALGTLRCNDNQLKALDVSTNTALTWLECRSNQLQELDVSQNTALSILHCNDNQLTELNLLQNVGVKRLYAQNNKLTGLDLSQNVLLTGLYGENNQLTSLDMRGMRSVSDLVINASATSNPLKTLSVHEKLQDRAEVKNTKNARGADVTISTYSAVDGSTDYMLECADYDPISETCLSTVSKPDFTVAFDLNGGVGNIDTLTVGQGQNATKPDPDPTRDGYTFKGWFADDDTFDNEFDFTVPITSDATLYAKWEKIPKFWIPDDNFRNKLKRLIRNAFDSSDSLLVKHAGVTERTNLDVNLSRIADLTGIEYFTSLTELHCVVNRIKKLDVSKNIALTRLNCHNNRLTSLNVSQNTRLQRLDCYDNRLTSLDVSNNPDLTHLNCLRNELLTELNVSQNIRLAFLDCSICRLTSLNVSKNTSLKTLYCHRNQLTDLDIRGMQSASILSINATAAENMLTSLKAHKNLQAHDEIKEVKTARGSSVKIETYHAESGSTDYTRVCADYDPNSGICADTP